MSSGLQCWDSSGRLIVDLGDYFIRYVGTQSITCGSGATSWSFPYSGMTTSGWIVTIVSTAYWQDYAVKCYDGGFRVFYLPTAHGFSDTLSVEIYRYE